MRPPPNGFRFPTPGTRPCHLLAGLAWAFLSLASSSLTAATTDKAAPPNLDHLAAQGVRLSNFHGAPLCSPIRAGLMTERWPIRYGMGESVITPWRKWGLGTDERTIANDTFVLFFISNGGITRRADHGPWRADKGTVYEGGIRTSALVRWPNCIKGGRSIGTLTGYIDIYPTLKRIAGSQVKESMPLDGRDLLGVIRGEPEASTREWFSYYAQGQPKQISLNEVSWKLIVAKDSVLDAKPGKEGPRIELFGLDRDPGEKSNLASAQPDRTAAMLKKLRVHRRLKIEGIPNFLEGKKDFVAPENWLIGN